MIIEHLFFHRAFPEISVSRNFLCGMLFQGLALRELSKSKSIVMVVQGITSPRVICLILQESWGLKSSRSKRKKKNILNARVVFNKTKKLGEASEGTGGTS